MRKMTALAIIVCLILTVPAFVVGFALAWVYSWILFSYIGHDTILDWIGVGIINDILMVWFPSLLQGIVGGALAMFITMRLFKKMRTDIVAYSVATLYVFLAVLEGVFRVATDTYLEFQTVHLISSTIGLVVGLFISETQYSSTPQTGGSATG